MKAFHDEEKDISSLEELKSIANSHSPLPTDLTSLFLEDSNLATEDVNEEAAENEGPSGSPFFVMSRVSQQKRKIVLSGFQSSQTFSLAFSNLSA